MKRHVPICIIALCLAGPAAAQTVYKCPDPSGNMKFQQMPCSLQGGGEALSVKPLPVMGVEAPGLRPGEQEMLQRAQHRIDAEKGQVRIGMTEEEAVRSWGRPDYINHSSAGDQWVYQRGPIKAQFLYFKNGRLTGFN